MKHSAFGLFLVSAAILTCHSAPEVRGQAENPDSTEPSAKPQESSPASTAAATVHNYNESPEAFLQRFFDTKRKAKSMMELKDFYVPGKIKEPDLSKLAEEQRKKTLAMIEVLFEGEKNSTPKKLIMTGKQEQNGEVIISTKTGEKISFDNQKTFFEPTAKYVLKKTGSGWQIVSEDYKLR